MLKYLEPQCKGRPKKTFTTQLQDGAFIKFSTFTLPLKIEFVIDSCTFQRTIWHHIYFCNYFRTLKLWLLLERP